MQDECHATGFMGKSGRGTDEHYGMLGEVDIVNSTLGKAMGGATGACRNVCRGCLGCLVIRAVLNEGWAWRDYHSA